MCIWNTMLECMYIGCHSEGILPGGLHVRRRAFDMHQNLIGLANYDSPQTWLEQIRKNKVEFRQTLQWVSCFALAVCEVRGGTPEQVLVAAEIAMEHHLGLTCDPIAGLVQIPCIERNTMGAIKAINAAELALA